MQEKEELVTFSRIYNNPKYKHVKTSPSKLKTLHIEGYIQVKTNEKGVDAVILSTLEKYIEIENEIMKNYIPLRLAIQNITRQNYNRKKGINLETYKKHFVILHNEGIISQTKFRNNIYINKTDIDRFLIDYISREEALGTFQGNKMQFWKMLKMNDIRPTYVSYHNLFYPRELLTKLIKVYNDKFILDSDKKENGTLINGKYYNTTSLYSTEEAKEILNLNKDLWKKLKREIKLESKRFGGKGGITFYPKNAIDELKSTQIKLRNEHYTSEEVKEQLGLNAPSSDERILTFKKRVPTLLRGLLPDSGIRYIFPKAEIDKKVLEYNIRRTASSITDPIESFDYQLESYNILEPVKNKTIVNMWIDYVYRVLSSTANDDSLFYTVQKYVNCTDILYTFLGKYDFVTITANNINLNLFNDNIPVTYQKVFYPFLKFIHDHLKYNSERKVFKFSRIINPRLYEKEERPVTLYEFDEYKSLLDYVQDVSYHKMKAIRDVKNYLSPSKNDYYNYDSAWLYVLVHLNNAWRHSDVINLPRIRVEETEVVNLEWLEQNDISFDSAKKIIQQIMRKDLKANKTNATNHFFCSDDLIIPLATAAIICELRTRSFDVIDQRNQAGIKKNLIDFEVKRNHFKDRAQKAFFKGLEKEFRFESLKMNRTLLTFTYLILVKQGNNNAALEVAQRLRAHYDFETTNIYIHIPEHELDNLTYQLFNREHFGYIPSILAEILYGEDTRLEQRTKTIQSLKTTFGDIYNIENTTGFLNAIYAERRLVIDMIVNMGYEEASELMFNLDANLLPSKEDHIQCIVGVPNCKKPNFACKNCPWAVPNYYALSSLADDLLTNVKKYNDEFRDSNFEIEKIKLSNILLLELDQWRMALQKFGQQEVYSFLECDKEEFRRLLKQIDFHNQVNIHSTYKTKKGFIANE